MDELTDIKEQLNYAINSDKNGCITTIKHNVGITCTSQLEYADKTIISGNIYEENGLSEIIYIIIDSKGQIVETLHEKEGVLPNFFLNSQEENWCLLTDLSTPKELEIAVPIKNRIEYIKPKGRRPFPGKFVGVLDDTALFHNFNYFSKTPDKLLKIEFKNGKLKSQKQIKIPFPARNKIYINQNTGLHLMARDENKLIHREIDLQGNVLYERTIDFGLFASFEIISLGFKEDSKIIFHKDNCLYMSIIHPDCQVQNTLIFENSTQIFNIWEPVCFDDDKYIVRFNFEQGNGWLIIQKDKLTNCFIHNNFNGYKSIITNEIVELPCNDLILSGITRVGANGYCVTIYTRTSHPKDNKEIFIFHGVC